MSTELPATTGNGHLLLASDLTGPTKCRNHEIRFLGVHHRHLFVTDPRRFWDFLERIGMVTHLLDQK